MLPFEKLTHSGGNHVAQRVEFIDLLTSILLCVKLQLLWFNVYSPEFSFFKTTHRFDPRGGGILQLKHKLRCVRIKDVNCSLISRENAIIGVAAHHGQVIDRMPSGLERKIKEFYYHKLNKLRPTRCRFPLDISFDIFSLNSSK